MLFYRYCGYHKLLLMLITALKLLQPVDLLLDLDCMLGKKHILCFKYFESCTLITELYYVLCVSTFPPQGDPNASLDYQKDPWIR